MYLGNFMDFINLNKWDKDIENFDANKNQLYIQIEEALRHSPNNVNYMWRRSWVAVILANSIKKCENTEQIRNLMSDAIKYAEITIKAYPRCFEAYISYCTAILELAQFAGIRQKIELSRKLEQHLVIASSLNADHYRLNHLFGCYYYDPLFGLNWFEKKLAKLFFRQMPSPSYDKSLVALFTAHQLRPNWIRNYLWMSKVLIALNRHNEAFIWMERALLKGFMTEEDVISRTEIIKLRYKYSK